MSKKATQQMSYFEQLKQKQRKQNAVERQTAAAVDSSAPAALLRHVPGHLQRAATNDSAENPRLLTNQDVDAAWQRAMQSCTAEKYVRRQNAKTGGSRTGWKTIRLFISSTFHDFQFERDILVKKVLPDLKDWCQHNKIHFAEVDLRWGVPRGADAEVALRTCLGELERCYSDNVFPFFLNMVSERCGWVPPTSQVPDSIRKEFDWIDGGLSITEMEVLHGAIRSKNPNALFLLRHPSFLPTVPDKLKHNYLDEGLPVSGYKSIKFREIIEQNFSDNQKVTYYARFDGEDASGYPTLTGFQSLMAEKVLEFFKQRILAQYPIGEADETSEWEQLAEMHEGFMRSEAGEIGELPVWDKQLADIVTYVNDTAIDVPYMLKAKSGSGKSSCLSTFLTRINKTNPNTKTFCHFVGALPGSIDYGQMVKRIAHFLGLNPDDTLENVVQGVCKKLSTLSEPTVIAIDAYNQLTQPQVSWLPYPLSKYAKVVITALPESGVAEMIQKSYPKPVLSKELIPMDRSGKQEMVANILGNYNKRLDDNQMSLLLSKSSSSSYYWLSLACEELRIFGHFDKLTEKIRSLPDDLVDLQVDIIRRMEAEQVYEDLLVATLCFLVSSNSGLLEVELLELLAEPPNLLPYSLRENRYEKKLPYKQWSEILRDIRAFVKSMGDPSEGRLKIYHATFGKAVRKIYFEELGEETAAQNYNWFHQKLASFFENRSTFERRLEEYPYHLAHLNQKEKLADFLTEWEIIDHYYSPEFSKHLSHLWSYVDEEYETMAARYLQMARESMPISGDQMLKLATICYQNGKYSHCNTIIDVMGEKSVGESWTAAFAADVKYLRAKSTEKMVHVQDVMFTLDESSFKSIETALKEAYQLMDGIPDDEHRRKAAELQNRIGMFYMSALFSEMPGAADEEQLRQQATEWVTRAQDAYKQLQHQIGVADTLTSLAVCAASAAEKEQLYAQALAVVGSQAIVEDITCQRLYMNLGIFHQRQGQFKQAKHFFGKYLYMSQLMHGDRHPETRRAIAINNKIDQHL